jgi:peptide-methionine (S)-S-oxide reductase
MRFICLILLFLFPVIAMAETQKNNYETATFAGGCFWCMQAPFDSLDGVISTMPGYTGGDKANPTYEQVSSGTTGHAESVEIKFDPAKISYKKLLEVFWQNIDPVDADGQFCDQGTQYRTAIFYHNDQQKVEAEQSKKELAASGKLEGPIATEIVAAKVFYPSEDYHKDYYLKNTIRYKAYRAACGRDNRLKKLWGK